MPIGAAPPRITLVALPDRYAICRLEPDAPIPAWADGEGFVSITRTPDELSVICLASRVPAAVRCDGGWRCFGFAGPFDFDQTGIAAGVLAPLAAAGIGILLVSTFGTDFLLVKADRAEAASAALRAAGHTVRPPHFRSAP